MAVIGITKGAFDGDIADAMHRLGGFSVRWINDPSDVNHVDGLILSGGGDVHPERYGEQMSDLIWGASRSRDNLEFSALELAKDSRTPVLGICRGHQVIGASLGVKLIPHISPNHARMGDGDMHPIRGTLEQFGDGVNSLHHQAVPNHPNLSDIGVNVLAIADNNVKNDSRIVEAMTGDNFVSCQWHPELDWNGVPISREIFLIFKDMVEMNA